MSLSLVFIAWCLLAFPLAAPAQQSTQHSYGVIVPTGPSRLGTSAIVARDVPGDQDCTLQASYILEPRLWWQAPPPLEHLTLVGYPVYRRKDNDPWQLMKVVPAGTTEHLGAQDMPLLETGHAYKYRVFARYRLPSGQEVDSKEALYAVPHPCFAFLDLPAPTALRGEIVVPK